MSLRRIYESTFIVNAALEDNDIDNVISKVTGYIENHGGQVVEINKWGRRRLAYPINKKYNGFYVHVVFDSKPNAIPILERFFVLEDTVLRHLTLILPKKLKDFREKRALEQGKVLMAAEEEVTDKPAGNQNRQDRQDRRYNRRAPVAIIETENPEKSVEPNNEKVISE
jgi:small subunit ribosomal protein S6